MPKLEAGSGYKRTRPTGSTAKWAGFKTADAEEEARRGVTGVDVAVLKDIGRKITKVPDGFHVHSYRATVFWRAGQGDRERRRDRLGDRCEALAFCTLMRGAPSRAAVGSGQRAWHLLAAAFGG